MYDSVDEFVMRVNDLYSRRDAHGAPACYRMRCGQLFFLSNYIKVWVLEKSDEQVSHQHVFRGNGGHNEHDKVRNRQTPCGENPVIDENVDTSRRQKIYS